MKPDIEIAREAHLLPITQIAARIGIPERSLELYGPYKAKINLTYCLNCMEHPPGKLVLVTATSPTPAGEGKTTTSIGLTDAMNRLNRQTAVCLREPSLGPVFGIKGGAAGGGYAQCVPMEDINLHFTGDLHAITSAHNTLAALLNNAIYRHKIELDPKKILWNRVVDVNDRALRNIIVGLGKSTDGVTHESGFDITAASEIMAILCLARNLSDLKEKIGNILLGFDFKNKPIYCRDLNVAGAITVLLKDAIKPNLVQTMENNPAFIHGGPFANIAQGANSIMATNFALRTNDYVVTEAGFGSDLGAEKFFDLVSLYGGFAPDLTVITTTIKALKMHGGQSLDRIKQENLTALSDGLANLGRHISNMKKFNIPVVVALNKFNFDTPAEIEMVFSYCEQLGVDVALSEVWEKGGEGGEALAKLVIEKLESPTVSTFTPLYDWNDSIEEKVLTVAREIYGAADVEFELDARQDIANIKQIGLDNLPICIAKTQKSFSDDPTKLGAPSGFTLKIRRVLIAAGAGFLIPIAGRMLRMPGLPMKPAAESIDIDFDGDVVGLF
ncbi:MAG: formate--tetrahydrofolate ligase [Candidatus Lokiarchaeota archaeon]|nr:formate--tetrahydrofolate ligase [Candidatus Harpocratesius repetitus]